LEDEIDLHVRISIQTAGIVDVEPVQDAARELVIAGPVIRILKALHAHAHHYAVGMAWLPTAKDVEVVQIGCLVFEQQRSVAMARGESTGYQQQRSRGGSKGECGHSLPPEVKWNYNSNTIGWRNLDLISDLVVGQAVWPVLLHECGETFHGRFEDGPVSRVANAHGAFAARAKGHTWREADAALLQQTPAKAEGIHQAGDLRKEIESTFRLRYGNAGHGAEGP